MRKPLVAGLVALALVLATGAYLAWHRSRHTELANALAAAPAGTERISWTDWAAVRRELGSDVDASSSPDELRRFLDQGYDAGLTSRSALLQSASGLQASFGFSPASAEWELFGQSRDGAVIALRMEDGIDFAEIADRLRDLGFPEPASGDGVWAGGPELLSSIDASLTPELGYLVLDADDHLVLASDSADYVEVAARTIRGDEPGVSGLDSVADAAGDPVSAALYTGDYACGALAMGQADADDQAEAADLVAAAGTVDPYQAFAMGALASGDVRVVMQFADDDQAHVNADSRAVLASGPAVGQGGDFADRFSVRSARADGALVLLDLEPVAGQDVLGDLTSGPVLFATC